MSDATLNHLVTNLSNQPLELYLQSGLRVLPPRSRTEVPAADLQSPQLLVLQRGRLVMVSQVAAPEQPPAHPQGEPEKPAATTASSKAEE